MDHKKQGKKELLDIIENLESRIASMVRAADLGIQIAEDREPNDAFTAESGLLRIILDAIPDLVYVKDIQSRFVFNNKAHRDWVGKSSINDARGKTDFDLFPHELASRYYADDQNLFKSGVPLVAREEPVQDHTGVMHWVSTTKNPIRGANNAVVGLIGVTRDITANKNFENALLHERALLYTLLDNIPDSIYFKDAQSRFIRVNRAWARRRGLKSPQEVVGKTDFEFFPRDLARRYDEDEQAIIRTGTPLINKIEKIEFPGQPLRWISITKVPVFNDHGRIVGTCGISREITQLVRAEEELARERDLLVTLMEYSTDFIYFKDRDSRFVRLNNAHARWLGFNDPLEMIGKTDFDVHSPEHAENALADERAILKTGIPLIGKVENESCPGHPEERWALTSKGPVFDKDHRIVGTFGISRDITRMKQVEIELQRANDELERRVAERTADLVAANERLEGRIGQLDFLTSATYDMAQFIHIDELMPSIVNAFAARFPAATASLCLRAENGFECRAAVGALDTPTGHVASAEALSVFARSNLQRPYFVDDWSTDDHLRQYAWPSMPHLVAYVAVPLLADNHTVAVLQMFLSSTGAEKYAHEEKVLVTLAAQAAIGISNALHYVELGQKARLQGELDAAHAIQQSFTPRYNPDIPGVNLKGVYYPAFEVGGDYLDYFQTSNGDWVVVIADVCGKGIPAAILMAVLRSTVRVEARDEISARELLIAVNRAMQTNLDDQSFITALCCIIKHDGSSMTYARAGHPLLLKINAGTNRVEYVEANGVALGLVADSNLFASLMDEVHLELKAGDRYLMYTDGLTEAWNDEKACYGVERLSELMQNHAGPSPEAILDTVLADIKRFTGDAAYHDDLTILALQVSGTPDQKI